MSRLWIFLICWSMALQGQAPTLFSHTDFKLAQQTAQQARKPLLVMLYASWCEHCKKMKAEVLPQPEVQALWKAQFVTVALDAEKPEGQPLARQYQVQLFPTFLAFDPQGALLGGCMGEFDTSGFVRECQAMLDPNQQLPSLKAAFESQPQQPQLCLNYVMALRKIRYQYQQPAQQYFMRVPDDQLCSEVHWKLIANGITDIRSREIQYVLRHQDDFVKVASAKRVARKLTYLAYEALMPWAESGDTLRYAKARKAVAEMRYPKADSVAFEMDCQLYEKVKDWRKYQAVTLAQAPNWGVKNPNLLRRMVQNYAQYITDEKALAMAYTWAESWVNTQPNKDAYLCIARIAIKRGLKAAAQQWLQQGIEALNQLHFDISALQQALKGLENPVGKD